MSALDATEARRQRGLAIAALSKIEEKHGCWTVPSQRGKGKYLVHMGEEPRCSCPDFEERHLPCKHIFAVQFVIQREYRDESGRIVQETISVTRRTCAERRTYKQDWPKYNLAQTREKAHFQALLADLCRGVPERPRKPGQGRKPVPMTDLVFAVAFKVYSTVSGRRFQTDLDEAHGKGYLSRSVRYNTVFEAFESDNLTPILLALIAESSLPLKSVESDFAVDSSGFATSRFIRWFDHKYGVVKQEYDWVKCHLMCGVNTNIVTAVEIGERYSGDPAFFRPLLKTTAASGFKPREVSADAAYTTYENTDAVAELGATPYMTFRSNTTAEQGGMMKTMFHLYNLNRDEYLSHYHKRSNVESTFSMIKAKFGDSLRSKTDTAMRNEALCKILCHNLCCLIQSHYELGIAAKFWGEEAVEQPEPEPEFEALPIDALAWI